MNCIEIIKHLERSFPKELAYEWDNVGVQVGSLNQRARKVLITLDVTKDVVKEAVDKKVDLIISHHPLIFKPLMNIQVETPRGWIINQLIKHGIALYTMHTNYDVAEGGMNDDFSKRLGVKDTSLLDDEIGIGRIGTIEETTFEEFVTKLKTEFSIEEIKLIGSPKHTISRVAFSLGSGSIHMNPAKRKNADVYLTGDVTYHTALDAIQMGLTVLDIGHYAERIFKDAIYADLTQAFPEIEILISEVDTNPFQVIS